MSEVAEDTAPAPKAEEPQAMVTIGDVTVPLKAALKAITDRDLYNEADRRGLIWDDDHECDYGISPRDLAYSVPDWILRRDTPEALRRLERALCDADSRFIGFADDVERHYARAR